MRFFFLFSFCMKSDIIENDFIFYKNRTGENSCAELLVILVTEM